MATFLRAAPRYCCQSSWDLGTRNLPAPTVHLIEAALRSRLYSPVPRLRRRSGESVVQTGAPSLLEITTMPSVWTTSFAPGCPCDPEFQMTLPWSDFMTKFPSRCSAHATPPFPPVFESQTGPVGGNNR